MRRYWILPAALLCALAPSAHPSAGKGPILPNAFGNWKASAVNSFTAQNAELLTPTQAAVLREYGLVGIEQADYVRGKSHLQATLYHMQDPTASYGTFTFLRTPEMHSAGVGDYSDMTATRALILRGNLLLEITGENLNAMTADLAALQSAVAAHAETGPYPSLDMHLPKDGLAPNSQRYMIGPQALQAVLPIASGDWTGFSHGAEAALGHYRLNREEVTLLLVDFPTPQAAASQLENYGAIFAINPTEGKDVPRNAVYATRDMTLIALVSGAHSRRIAGEILKHIGAGEEVTWNEPSLSAKPRPTDAQILIGIFAGTGILCAYALIAGLAFGGVRLLTKRVLPGRVFDRDTSAEILQLGITSKPVKGGDFFHVGPPR
jgi:hypothetical protein